MTLTCRRAARAFTLVELLVVIGIIALLISILLPSLAKARKAANTVKCSANIRSIVQGMQIYASQNNGAIPGSAWTTARFIYNDVAAAALNPTFSATNCPSVIQIFDWASPIAKVMGVKFDEGETQAARLSRFNTMREFPGFICPENEFLAVPFSASSPMPTVGRMVSYNTAIGFMVARNNNAPSAAVGRTVGRIEWNPPSGYSPKTSKVGDASRKIFIADGSRFSTTANPPDIDLTYTGSNGGAFGDQGPTKFSRSWDRGLAAGNTPASAATNDSRIYAYRHGSIARGSKGDSFRFNAGFFDGHVETLGDLQGSDPRMWFPKGTQLVVDNNQYYQDVMKQYFNNQTYTFPNFFIVP